MGQKAFLYAIVDPRGQPHLGQRAVAQTRDELRDEVEALNEELGSLGPPYRIVALYLRENR